MARSFAVIVITAYVLSTVYWWVGRRPGWNVPLASAVVFAADAVFILLPVLAGFSFVLAKSESRTQSAFGGMAGGVIVGRLLTVFDSVRIVPLAVAAIVFACAGSAAFAASQRQTRRS